MKVKSESEVAQSCPTLRDPMDCSLPGSSIHGIFQARVLQWGAIAFSTIGSTLLLNQFKMPLLSWPSRPSITWFITFLLSPFPLILPCGFPFFSFLIFPALSWITCSEFVQTLLQLCLYTWYWLHNKTHSLSSLSTKVLSILQNLAWWYHLQELIQFFPASDTRVNLSQFVIPSYMHLLFTYNVIYLCSYLSPIRLWI